MVLIFFWRKFWYRHNFSSVRKFNLFFYTQNNANGFLLLRRHFPLVAFPAFTKTFREILPNNSLVRWKKESVEGTVPIKYWLWTKSRRDLRTCTPTGIVECRCRSNFRVYHRRSMHTLTTDVQACLLMNLLRNGLWKNIQNTGIEFRKRRNEMFAHSDRWNFHSPVQRDCSPSGVKFSGVQTFLRLNVW